jgi:hypothetical protein
MNEPNGNNNVPCLIANCAFKVVSGLLNRDQLLAERLRSPTTNSRQIYREDCITVDMLSTLKEQFPNHVEIIMFTAAEETRNGADWYWRIEKSNGAIHALVQAKRVRRSTFGEDDADGNVEIDAGQIRDLIAAARSDPENFPSLQAWLATYARCDATPPCGGEPSMCERHGCGGSCTSRGKPSVWIAQAEHILESKHSRADHQTKGIKDIVEESVRLDCILPCIDPVDPGGPGVKGFIVSANLPSFDKCVATIQSNPSLQARLEGAMRIRL